MISDSSDTPSYRRAYIASFDQHWRGAEPENRRESTFPLARFKGSEGIETCKAAAATIENKRSTVVCDQVFGYNFLTEFHVNETQFGIARLRAVLSATSSGQGATAQYSTTLAALALGVFVPLPFVGVAMLAGILIVVGPYLLAKHINFSRRKRELQGYILGGQET